MADMCMLPGFQAISITMTDKYRRRVVNLMSSTTHPMLDQIHSDTLANLLTAVNLQSQSNLKLQHAASELAWPLLSCGDVVEIQGPPSSGKTHLLYSLLINCTIPHSHQSTVLGGWAKAGVVFDMDGSFDMIRFNQLLLGHLTRLLPDSGAAKSITQESLGRLHIFRPTSSIQLAATITHLPKYHVAYFPRVAIGLVAIDSMSSFYWPDRFTAEQMQMVSTPTECEKNTPGFSLALHHVLIALKLFHSTHGSTVVLNNWGLHPISGNPSAMYKQHLHPFPNPFMVTRPSTSRLAGTSFSPDYLPLTYHITVSSTHSPRFQSGLSMIEAKDRETNRRPTDEFIGLIRIPKHSAANEFVFRIASNFVSVDW